MVLSFNVSFQNCCFKLVDKCYVVINNQASLVAQMVKNLPTRQETLDSWVGKIPWRRKWLPAPVFLPGKAHRQRGMATTVHGVAKSRT